MSKSETGKKSVAVGKSPKGPPKAKEPKPTFTIRTSSGPHGGLQTKAIISNSQPEPDEGLSLAEAAVAELARKAWGSKVDPAMLTNICERVEEVRRGVPYSILLTFITEIGLSMREVSSILSLPERTLLRRKSGRLAEQESDRFIRLVRIWNRTVEVLGADEKARAWLWAHNDALGTTPILLLDTDLGTQAVETVLGRIENGIFS